MQDPAALRPTVVRADLSPGVGSREVKGGLDESLPRQRKKAWMGDGARRAADGVLSWGFATGMRETRFRWDGRNPRAFVPLVGNDSVEKR